MNDKDDRMKCKCAEGCGVLIPKDTETKLCDKCLWNCSGDIKA